MYGDWSLTYPGVELRFGTRASGMGLGAAPAVGLPEEFLDDTAFPDGDGVIFGRDLIAGQTVTFDIDVIAREDRDAVRTMLQRMRHAWRADSIRKIPGAVAMLRADTGRVAFGRPRRFVSDDQHDRYGYSKVTADFAMSTDLWFGDVQSASVSLVPAPSGGLIAPLASPLSTTESSDRSQAITVDGELPTWPTVTIFGPITNPVVEIGPVRWELRATLAYDQSVTIDASPWARTILRDGAGIPGALTPQSTRLVNATIPPGLHEFVLRGTSQTGTARAAVSWRPAFPTF